MIELLIAFTVGLVAGMAIEKGVRRVEWQSVLSRRAKARPRRNDWTTPSSWSRYTASGPTRRTSVIGLDEVMAELRQHAELRPEGTDD